MAHILLVEDNTEIAQLVTMVLCQKHRLTHAESLQSAKELLTDTRFDLLIFDLNLPDGHGFDLFEWTQLQKNQKAPVIFLTGEDDVSDRIRGFELGAQDYITKPFYSAELLARVNSRLPVEAEKSDILLYAGLKFEWKKLRAFYLEGTREHTLSLTPNEYKILFFLCENLGRSVTRTEIISNVWGEGFSLSNKVINTHISNLRKKIPADKLEILSDKSEGYFIKSS